MGFNPTGNHGKNKIHRMQFNLMGNHQMHMMQFRKLQEKPNSRDVIQSNRKLWEKSNSRDRDVIQSNINHGKSRGKTQFTGHDLIQL